MDRPKRTSPTAAAPAKAARPVSTALAFVDAGPIFCKVMKASDTQEQEGYSGSPPSPSVPAKPRGWRIGFFLLGWLFFGVGAVGAVLPVLPTTPFMILALWAFARSSTRFHDWLYTHRIFGPPLRRWSEHRVIPRHAKVAAVAAMSASLTYLIWFSNVPAYAIALTALIMAVGAAYVLSRPSRIRG